MKTQYDEQADDFLKQTNSVLKIDYKKTGKYFDNDKEERDIYTCTFSRGSRSCVFDFGQSIANSRYKVVTREFNRNELKGCFDKTGKLKHTLFNINVYPITSLEYSQIKYPSAPTNYDILACLTKYDPRSFEDFCSEYGYNTDSRSAERIYNAVKDEYQNLCALFNESEMEKLREIQ